MRSAKPLSLMLASALAGVAVLVFAQTPAKQVPVAAPPKTDPSYEELNLQTNIGSFKLIDGVGRVDVAFSGTMLISQLKGTVTPSGNLRKEYDDRGKTIYHGTGRIVIDGQFRGIQWFGSNMKGRWVGRGVARIVGEFDKNLETGYYWYGSAVDRKGSWSMYGLTLTLPESKAGGTGVPQERPGGKPGGG